MADTWEAPAKVNLSLRVGSLRGDGFHPLRSIVQAVDWCDRLEVAVSDEYRLTIDGGDLDPGDDNLVWKAVDSLVGRPDRPRLDLRLVKSVPVAAGLGGGSSDAAAALCAAARVYGVAQERVRLVAPQVGSDVPFFLGGGSALMEGRGELLTEIEPLDGFAVAIVVPDFSLSTPEVFRRWDELGGPAGSGVKGGDLPPMLRGGETLVNDLLPAALDLEPRLGDFMVEIASIWSRSVAMSGSGTSVFGYFADLEEATEAAVAVHDRGRASTGASLRPVGVCLLDR